VVVVEEVRAAIRAETVAVVVVAVRMTQLLEEMVYNLAQKMVDLEMMVGLETVANQIEMLAVGAAHPNRVLTLETVETV